MRNNKINLNKCFWFLRKWLAQYVVLYMKYYFFVGKNELRSNYSDLQNFSTKKLIFCEFGSDGAPVRTQTGLISSTVSCTKKSNVINFTFVKTSVQGLLC